MQYPSRASVRPVDAISARCRETLKRNIKRATGAFRAATREQPRGRSAGAVFGDPYGRRKTHEQPRQNRDKSTTKNAALRLSRRDKTGTKVRQKTRPCRCLSVSKPCQKWAKNPTLRAVTVCQNRDKSATRIRGCALSRAVFLVKAFQQESGHFRVIAIILP